MIDFICSKVTGMPQSGSEALLARASSHCMHFLMKAIQRMGSRMMLAKPRVDDRTVISGIHRSEIHPLPPSIEQVVSQK
jgi:hypothetical protein